ncbi:hypothetical protein LSCM1_03198 [Leishmania martiniquensis]|uniref:SMP-LTD domain-containing protein n=1 Tax=Leishmania martiniquensis TaxID=1580590 RepID=A0A836HB32_9TRYP|nr:hypothetical protein LSCM1_03198 [Leishmania martiniquensis]
MSLHFNWSRLDETCAEALRSILNKRLAEVVERIGSRSAAHLKDDAAGSALTTAKMSEAVLATAPGISGGAASSCVGPCGGGSVGAAGAGKMECLPSFGNCGSPQEKLTGLAATPASAAAGAIANRRETISDPPCSSAVLSVAALHPCSTPGHHSSAGLSVGGAAVPSTSGAMALSGSAGGSAGGSGGSGVGLGVSLSGPSINAAAPPHSGVFPGTGAAVLGAEMNSGNNGSGPSESVSFAGEPTIAPSMNACRSTAGTPCAAAAAGGASPVLLAPAGGEGARRVPPIVYLEVSRLEWGTTPPFVEIVAFENARDGPPGRTRQHLQQQQPTRGLFGGGREVNGTGPETRDRSPCTSSHPTSIDTLMATSTATVEPGAGLTAAVDSTSEGSQGLASQAHTRAHTPHPMTGPYQLFDAASAGTAAAGGGGCTSPHQRPPSSSTSQFPSQPEAVDSLASVLGPGGLYVRFHVTYGGSMHLSLNTAVQHEIRLGAVALRVNLPMMFYLANLDLDCYVCVNMKHSVCELWLEPGPLSPSLINRLTITATIGGDDDGGSDLQGGRKNSVTGDYGTSSIDFYSHFGSSISDDDGGEEGSGVYVNEHEVSQFVLHELRAILRETLVAPHSVCISVPFSDSGISG